MKFWRSSARAASALCIVCASVFVSAGASADEGMWTFDDVPTQRIAKSYGFAPSKAWLDHVRMSSLRVSVGCSASFISPHGLVLTNHHCVTDCVDTLSTPQQNGEETGYAARTGADEKKCPGLALEQLIAITDVTADVLGATAGKTGEAANLALNAENAKLQARCGSDPALRCDVVSLYHGGVYALYQYRRYDDVRLVFAPEFAVGQFGGDPDNFHFPRYDFDIGLLRVYENGQPLANTDYLKWSPNGSKAGELVFSSGDPGPTSRQLTIAQLAFSRDRAFPEVLPEFAELRGQLEQFITRGPEQARVAGDDLFFLENDFKVGYGEQAALLDPVFFAALSAAEARLRAAVAKNRSLAAADGSAWNDIAEVQKARAALFTRTRVAAELSSNSMLLRDAITLVRAAAERTKPNPDRLPEFSDQSLRRIALGLAAPDPVSKDLEELDLAFAFTIAQRDLGPDDSFVRALLGSESPQQLARRLVTGTQLDDPKVRMSLYAGGAAAIAASSDPLVRFAVAIDPELRAVRKRSEDVVDAPTRAGAERIAKARFAIDGRSVAPDGTLSPRLSYGTVAGFVNAEGSDVAPYTTIGGLFARASGAPPYVLPPSWLGAKAALDVTTPLNFSLTTDTTGGSSGSPVIDRDARIVGVEFDGNIFSLGGEYGYDAAKNRDIAVDSRAVLEVLHAVYHLDGLVAEIQGGS